jgi:threonine/homoserine/homoserine lactone efflux protein
MKLNPPKKVTFWISIFAFVVGAAMSVGLIPGLTVIGFIVCLLAYLLLVLGLLIKGL